jgi:AAA family ATP:ADP antiporter
VGVADGCILPPLFLLVLAGKAAIDVVGAQSGKSVSSLLQQVLLIVSGGSLGGILPVLAAFYFAMLHGWHRAVDDLAEHYDPAESHRMSVMGSMDEDDGAGGVVLEVPVLTPA